MGTSLSKIICSIGIAVQKANREAEYCAKEIYIAQGYSPKEETQNGEKPMEYKTIAYSIKLPGGQGEKAVTVPAAALQHNTSMRLDHVGVKLKFTVDRMDDEDIYITPVSAQEKKTDGNDMISELTVQFNNAPPSEGLARVNDRQLQII
jgi:hypothetical protein